MVRAAAARKEEVYEAVPSWREAELIIADALGQLMEFWGFKRHMGRIWGVLYLSPEPLFAAQLCEALQMSSGAVSMALGELNKWGAIRKCHKPGERRDYYEVETRVWKLLRRVFERRELNLILEAAEAFEDAELYLKSVRYEVQGAERRRVDFMRRRLAQLRLLTKVGERLVRTFVAGRVVDPGELRAVDPEGER